LNPSSSSDPFGIRRTVNGLLRILEERPGYIPLLEFVNTGMEAYRQINGLEFDETTVLTEWKAYYIQRMQSFLSGSVHFGKHRYDLVQAVLNRTDSRLVRSPHDIKQQVEAMEAHVTDPEFKALCQSFVRIQKILNTSFQSGSINPDKLELKAEQALLSIGQSIEKELKTLFHIDNSSIECFDPKKILSTLYQLNHPIQQFFDEVMVMVEDVAIRENRLRLLSWLLSMMSDFADFSTIVFDGGNEQ
jgi:glycyl-tRNA synthetase beta chain